MEYHSHRRAVHVARLLYLIICIIIGLLVALLIDDGEGNFVFLGVIIGLLVGGFFILVESLAKDFSVRGFSTATFGLCIGLFCAWLLQTVNLPGFIGNVISFFDIKIGDKKLDLTALAQGFNFFMFSSLAYVGVVLALRTNQDDFAIVIPFIRFRQESQKARPLVCSVDILVDGRVTNLIESGFLSSHLIFPPFVVEELQALANSPTDVKNLQGKRGLDTMQKLKDNPNISISTHKFEVSHAAEAHDAQTILTCQQIDSRLLTCDENLAQVATVQGINVLNLKNLSQAMKPKIEVGQRLHIAITKTGKEDHQGVGYLPDGTMIVINEGGKLVGTSKDVIVVSSIQTSAGLMVFTEISPES